MEGKRFEVEKLDEVSISRLTDLARLARGDILKMTTLAGSGHPGGSMSSIDFYLVLYSYANVRPRLLRIQTGIGSSSVTATPLQESMLLLEELVSSLLKQPSSISGRQGRPLKAT